MSLQMQLSRALSRAMSCTALTVCSLFRVVFSALCAAEQAVNALSPGPGCACAGCVSISIFLSLRNQYGALACLLPGLSAGQWHAHSAPSGSIWNYIQSCLMSNSYCLHDMTMIENDHDHDNLCCFEAIQLRMLLHVATCSDTITCKQLSF